VASAEQKVTSTEQKVTNTEQKVTSTEQKVASTEQKVASTQEQQVPIDPNDVNAKTLAQLNTLMEESLQIYELEDQKTNIIDDLHNALQVITQFLGFSTNIHPEIFNLPSDATVTLLPNLKIIIKLTNGKTETKQFTDYAPETITKIVEHVTPQLLELIKAQKSYLTEKITFLRTATKQLSTLSQLKENLPSFVASTEEE
ncbi:MAG: hypothetical protein QQN45_05000, partial [Nitrosopumilus sp.]